MNITKIALAAGPLILGAAAAFSGLTKPTFTLLTTIYFTNGAGDCPSMSVNSCQYTTNGNPGTGVQATIKTSHGGHRRLWGVCNAGAVSHPAHFHANFVCP